MSWLYDLALTALYFTGFAVIHTITASKWMKRLAAVSFPGFMPWYRLSYNIISLVTLYIFYDLSPKNGYTIYDLPTPVDLVFAGLQFLCFTGMGWVFRYISGSEFMGMAQPFRGMKGSYRPLQDLDEIAPLRIEGPYRFSRHPLYLFCILFLALRPQMQVDYLFLVILITAYFYIGSIFEERKLVGEYGETYLNYQKSVGRIFPKVLGRIVKAEG